MASLVSATIVELPVRHPPAVVSSLARDPETVELAEILGARIAAAAGADDWALFLDGQPIADSGASQELLFSPLGAVREAATYRLTLPLRAGYRQVGLVRLATDDPGGFRPPDIARARTETARAGNLLAAALSGEDRDQLRSELRRGYRSTAEPIRLDTYRRARTSRARPRLAERTCRNPRRVGP